MQKLSIKRISILGLALMAASAVTAAMVPNKADKKPIKFAEGSLTLTSNDNDQSSMTCNPDSDDHFSQQACTASTGDSLTTTRSGNPTPGTSNNAPSSDNLGGVGENNTSSL